MSISFNLELNSKPNKQGLYVVFIRITQDRKKKRIKTSVALKRLNDWNKEKQIVRASEPSAKVLNQALENELNQAKVIYRELNENGLATSAGIISKMKDVGTRPTLLAYSKKVREQMLKDGHLGNWQKYGTFINLLEKYLDKTRRGEDVAFKEVTLEFVQGFENFMGQQENQRTKSKYVASGDSSELSKCRLSPNTIAKNMKIFRAIVNRAMNIEGFVKVDSNPFKAKKIRETQVIKDKLEQDELTALASLDLEHNSSRWHARNVFFFSYYCAGIRASDLMQLRWCNISDDMRLSYQMGKNHKIKNVILVCPARAILKQYRSEGQKSTDYIFPYLNSNASYSKAVTQEDKDSMPVTLKQALFAQIHNSNIQINRRLKALAEMAGIAKDVTLHTSRHSFARQAMMAGVDNVIIKKLLNHSSLATTERYMGGMSDKYGDDALEIIFSLEDNTSDNTSTSSKEDLIKALKSLYLEGCNQPQSTRNTNQ